MILIAKHFALILSLFAIFLVFSSLNVLAPQFIGTPDAIIDYDCSQAFNAYPIILSNHGNHPGCGSVTYHWTTLNGLQLIDMRVNVNYLSISSNQRLEAWLVDLDTGYKQSAGAFWSEPGATGDESDIDFHPVVQNAAIFDQVWVTIEPLGDTNPNPGTVVLKGNLH